MLLLASAFPAALCAQSAANPDRFTAVLERKPMNYGLFTQGGVGLTEDRNSFRFLTVGVQAGKVLSGEFGPGLLRGSFEYGVQVLPFWQSYTPVFQRANCVLVALPTGTTGTTVNCSALYNTGGTYTGVSVTPILLKWNFAGGKKIAPWVQGAGGLVWTNHKYPGFGSGLPYAGTTFGPPNGAPLLNNDGPNADTSVWNFTPQFGVGVHLFTRPDRSIDFGANAIHISSASLGDKNPGVNASVQFSLGYSWWK